MAVRWMGKHRFLMPAVLLVAMTVTTGAFWFDNDLHLSRGNKTRKFDAKNENGQDYYELERIVEFLGLRFGEVAERAIVEGPGGGRIVMNHQRATIGVRGQQMTLAQPPLRRKKNRWLVSEEFVARALPLIVDGQVSRAGNFRYEFKDLEVVNAELTVSTAGDHVRIVLESPRAAAAQIVESADALRIRIPNAAVRPNLSGAPADKEIVQSVEVDTREGLASFVIRKGKNYLQYRETAEGQRRIFDIFGKPVEIASVVPVAPPPPAPELPPPPIGDIPVDVPAPPPPEQPIPFTRKPTRGIVTLDPGHGGSDYGVRPGTESMEKNYTLALAQLVRRSIESRSDLRVVISRQSDSDLSAEARSGLANSYRSEAFVSLHFGGSYNSAIQGPQAYIHRAPPPPPAGREEPTRGLVPWDRAQLLEIDRSRSLAQTLQSELNGLFGVQGRNPVSLPLEVLRGSISPAAVVECGYLTNPGDARKIVDPEFFRKLSDSLATAVLKFLGRVP